jgi:uncharacterized RDD family membrane protein YckC
MTRPKGTPSRRSGILGLALLALLLATPATVRTQVQPAPPRPTAPPRERAIPPEPPDDVDVFTRSTRNAIRIGQDFRLASGDFVRDAVVIFGDARIAGEVDGNLVVVLGNVDLASTAVLRGDFISVGGNVTAAQGVTARREFIVIGGEFNAPPGFIAGGEQLIIGGGMLGDWLRELAPYLTRGLLWGRLIVPDLPWVWSVVGVFLFLYLALNLMFAAPVKACATTLEARPLRSFGAGLLVLLLVGPVCLLLAVSVIGLAVVPFVIFALIAGWIVGKVGFARWVGMGIIAEDVGSRAQGTRSVLIGFALISIAYLIPVLGIAAWAIGGVLGLGASALAFLSAYRREKPVAAVPDIPPPPVPTTYSTYEPVVPPPVPDSGSPSMGASERPPALAFEAMNVSGGGAAAAAIPLTDASPSVLATMPKALFRDRLAAFVLDIVLLVVVVNIFSGDPDEWAPLLVLGYHVGFWTWKQTTVGGLICQIRLVRTDGTPLTFADALIRALASIFSLGAFFIGALWILRDPDNQAWHDKIAGTYVVKVPRGWPL